MFRSILLLIMLLLVACQDGAIPEGRITATKDMESWSSNAIAVFEPSFGDSLISIIGKVFNNQGFIQEELAFFKIPPRVGIYNLSIEGANPNSTSIKVTYAILEGDGHVIAEFQTLDTFYQNKFSVDAFDESSRTINASFECRMMHVNDVNDTTYTIFKDGRIEVAIEDY